MNEFDQSHIEESHSKFDLQSTVNSNEATKADLGLYTDTDEEKGHTDMLDIKGTTGGVGGRGSESEAVAGTSREAKLQSSTVDTPRYSDTIKKKKGIIEKKVTFSDEIKIAKTGGAGSTEGILDPYGLPEDGIYGRVSTEAYGASNLTSGVLEPREIGERVIERGIERGIEGVKRG